MVILGVWTGVDGSGVIQFPSGWVRQRPPGMKLPGYYKTKPLQGCEKRTCVALRTTPEGSAPRDESNLIQRQRRYVPSLTTDH
jgi:hypothetical protein